MESGEQGARTEVEGAGGAAVAGGGPVEHCAPVRGRLTGHVREHHGGRHQAQGRAEALGDQHGGGAGPAVNWTLVALTPAVFLAGVALALRLRRARPDVYARLGTTDVD
ncbi:hypothetical protein [Streptomyces djakartensis]|uniref:Uncharacterized protein n=1 Tax=Streptomyces djakartensis TaxID=68193 RepID=A0ABQ2ZI72_9ACTN|nr:hypothetical protein [Streptomyces djakartensis]GGY14068.1 hypothetical protein GCM10010384_19860 [Streptomyces djakartensis]